MKNPQIKVLAERKNQLQKNLLSDSYCPFLIGPREFVQDSSLHPPVRKYTAHFYLTERERKRKIECERESFR